MDTNSSPLTVPVIYVMSIHDADHSGCLKIGQVLIKGASAESMLSLLPNTPLLKEAANARIKHYIAPMKVEYELLYTELAASSSGNGMMTFSDVQVHHALEQMGVTRKTNEWFETDLETVKLAIQSVKDQQ